MRIRPATAADLPAIGRLFNALIATTTVAWRDHPAGTGELRTWFADQQDAGYPVLVADLDGLVAGYTCWSPFRGGERFPGYRHTVEHTIHVDSAHHGRGIDSDNAGSLAFHHAMGFSEVARMPEVGRKFDRWLDLVLMQRILR